MIGYYLGMFLIALGSAFCLRETLNQWRKAENISEQIEAHLLDEHKQLRDREAEHRAYAVLCLCGSGALALINIIAGGIVWACG